MYINEDDYYFLTRTSAKSDGGDIIKQSREFKMRRVRSQRLAGKLMEQGFVLLSMGPDPKDPKWNVFYFRDSPELNRAIEKIRTKETKGGENEHDKR